MKLFLNTLLLLALLGACKKSAPAAAEPCIVQDSLKDTCDMVLILDSADSECDTITFDTLGKDVMLIGD